MLHIRLTPNSYLDIDEDNATVTADGKPAKDYIEHCLDDKDDDRPVYDEVIETLLEEKRVAKCEHCGRLAYYIGYPLCYECEKYKNETN
jgi:hypothetical protein